MVFGDYVVNGALAAGYDVSSGQSDHPPIYNILSSNDYITTFRKSLKFSSIYHCYYMSGVFC